MGENGSINRLGKGPGRDCGAASARKTAPHNTEKTKNTQKISSCAQYITVSQSRLLFLSQRGPSCLSSHGSKRERDLDRVRGEPLSPTHRYTHPVFSILSKKKLLLLPPLRLHCPWFRLLREGGAALPPPLSPIFGREGTAGSVPSPSPLCHSPARSAVSLQE